MQMLLFVVLAVCALSSAAVAQTAGGYSAGPGRDSGEPGGDGTFTPSPEWTQDRTFPGTRFWKLDPGRYEVEQWWRFRKPRGEAGYHILQTELEFGLTPRIQFDLYENLIIKDGKLDHEGNQIEVRIAVDPVYGRTPLNPVIYIEWHPRHLDGDRAEVRLLGGDQILGEKLVGAFNLFYEQNLTRSPDGMGGATYVPNPEAGITAAASYAVAGQSLRLGAEMKYAIEKGEWSDASWEQQLLVGPNLSTRIIGERLKAYITVLFGITDDAKKVDSFFILASGF